MKILLAPSETKTSGGEGFFSLDSLFLKSLFSSRKELIEHYQHTIETAEIELLSSMFGLKKESEILRYKQDLFKQPTMKAIERYTGVAFDYLDYRTLKDDAKAYLGEHLILFSNLFGVLQAHDMIPDYRLQQNKPIGTIKPDKYYKPLLQKELGDYLLGEEVLDLRATFYNKYYSPLQPYTILKFIKEGKVVSHWAKAYRGIVLREIAKNKIESLDAFVKLPIKGLQIKEIQKQKNRTEIIYDIISV